MKGLWSLSNNIRNPWYVWDFKISSASKTKRQKQCNYFPFCCKHILSLKYKQFLTRKWFQQNLKILSEYFMNLETELLSKVRFSRVSWFFTEQFLLPSWSGLNDCFLKSGAILPGPPLYVAHIVLLYMHMGQHTFDSVRFLFKNFIDGWGNKVCISSLSLGGWH